MTNYTLFLRKFFNDMLDAIEDNRREALTPVNSYPALSSMREALFKKYDICLSSVDEDALVEQIPDHVKEALDDIELSHQDFVDVVFLKKTTLEEKLLIEYIKNIHNNDDWTVGLYHFQDFLHEKSYEVKDFKTNLLAGFDGMKEGQSFELLSNIAVFMEAYAQTYEGREFLNNDFTMDKPQDSFRELFRRMNNASVFNAVAVKNDKDGNLKCQYTSGAGGEFDGLYIFPDDKGGLMVKQAQISATSYMGVGINKNSVFRHAIANVIIAKALNNAFNNKNLTALFKVSPKNYGEKKIDVLQKQKQEALLDVMKEYYPGSFSCAVTFKDLIKDLKDNLHDYIYDCFGEKPPLKAYAVIDTMKELKHVDVSNVFISKTAYKGHPEYKNSTLGNMLGNTVDLNMEEFRHGLQLVSISTFNRDNRGNEMFLQNEGLKVAFSGIISRCIDYCGNVASTKLNKLGQDEFEKILFENFVFESEENVQRNYDVIGDKEVKMALNDYIRFIVLGSDDNGNIYDQKIKDLDFENRQSLKETCEKLSNIQFLDPQSALSQKIKDKEEILIIREEKLIMREEKLFNKGLRGLTSSEEEFKNFISEYNIEERDILSIRELKKLGFDGEDNEATIEKIRSIKDKNKNILMK